MVNDANRALFVARGFALLSDNKQLGYYSVNNMLQICYKFYNIKKHFIRNITVKCYFSAYIATLDAYVSGA